MRTHIAPAYAYPATVVTCQHKVHGSLWNVAVNGVTCRGDSELHQSAIHERRVVRWSVHVCGVNPSGTAACAGAATAAAAHAHTHAHVCTQRHITRVPARTCALRSMLSIELSHRSGSASLAAMSASAGTGRISWTAAHPVPWVSCSRQARSAMPVWLA